MPIRSLLRTAVVLAACALAPLVAARTAQADTAGAAVAKPPVPLLWKVTGPGDSRLYLLGSFHLLKPQDYPLSPDVEQAFEASQRVVFELSPEDMQSPQLASRMVQAAVRTDGSELKRDLDAATWQKLQVFATENKLPLAQMQGMKPWFVGLSISVGQMQKMGLDPALGLDRHFMERAQKTGRKTAGLEDIDTQIGMLDGMTLQEQRQMLAEALDQAGKADEQARQLHDAWRRGDLQAAEHVAERDLSLSADSGEQLLERVQAHLLWQAYQSFFAVIFWYFLLGPVAALAYRLLALASEHSQNPLVAERAEIFRIHLAKRDRDPEQFDLQRIAKAAVGFSGAEIEESIISALFDVFNAGRKLATDDVLRAISETVPLSRTMDEVLAGLRDWADGRARFASPREQEIESSTARKLEF